VSGRSHGRQRAVFMSATGQFRGRLWAVSRVRCQGPDEADRQARDTSPASDPIRVSEVESGRRSLHELTAPDVAAGILEIEIDLAESATRKTYVEPTSALHAPVPRPPYCPTMTMPSFSTS